MMNMTESPSWEDSIELIARSERVSGGQDGVANRPLKKLANRTRYLKEKYDGLNTDLSGKVEAVKTFAGGAVLNSPREEILYGILRLVWTGTFPKEVAPGSSPQTTGGVGVGAWAYTSDAVIRHDLASYLGPSFMGMPEGGTLFDLLGGWVCPEMYGATAGDESAAHANSKAFYRMFEVLRRRGGGVIYMKPGATYCVDFINFVPANVRLYACGATIKHINPISAFGRGGLVIGGGQEWNYATAKAAYESDTYPAAVRDDTLKDLAIGDYLEFNEDHVQAENVDIYDLRMEAAFTDSTSWGGYAINVANARHVRIHNLRAKGWTQAFNFGSDVHPSSPSCYDVRIYNLVVEAADPNRTYYAFGFIANSTECEVCGATLLKPLTAGTRNGSGLAVNAVERCRISGINIPDLGRTVSSEGVLINNARDTWVDDVRVGNAKSALSTFYSVDSYNDASHRNIIGRVYANNCDQAVAIGAKYAVIQDVKSENCTQDIYFRNINATGNILKFEPGKMIISDSSVNKLFWYLIYNTVKGWVREYIRVRPIDMFRGNFANLYSWDTNKSVKMNTGITAEFIYTFPRHIKALDAVTFMGNFSVGAQVAADPAQTVPARPTQLTAAIRYMASDDPSTAEEPVIPASGKVVISALTQGDGDFIKTFDLHGEALGFLPLTGSVYGVDNSMDMRFSFVNGVAANTMKPAIFRVWR